MKQPNSHFQNKFSNYLQKTIPPQKNKQLFLDQFFSSSNHQNHQQCKSPSVQSIASSQFSPSLFSSGKQSIQKTKTLKIKKNEDANLKIKRLKKQKECQQNECAICLDQINDRCELACKHKFCLQCLEGWLANCNKCPYCRGQVTCYQFKGQQYKVQHKQYQHQADINQQIDWICYNCTLTQQGDIVLICDGCQAYACHIACDTILHGVVPQGQWFCHYCR